MDWLHVVILAVLQGLTEFLPISSSAHLILMPRLFGWQDQQLIFDIAVHVGTLSAVLIYFRRDLKPMFLDWASSVRTRKLEGEAGLAWAVLVGTIPVGAFGLLADHYEESLRNPMIIAFTTIFFGILLGWSDRKGGGQRSEHAITWRDVLLIGFAQALALIPGTSRSGITMTAGLFAGLSRTAAARFSFLLSIPVIVLAASLKIIELIQSGTQPDLGALLGGALISGLSAYFCIEVFIRLLERVGMLPFVIYRILLGIVLFAFFAPI